MNKYIYVLIDPRNDNIKYVGQTKNKLYTRLRKHICDSKNNKHKNANWIKKLTKLNLQPIIKLIDIVPLDDLGFWEMFYILKYKTNGILLNNHTTGGEGSIGYKHTKKSKQLISNKAKIRLSNPKNNPMYNKKHTKNSKEIMSIKKKKIYDGVNNPRAKTIYQFDLNLNLISQWSTAKECADLYNLSRGNISSSASYNCKIDLENECINNKINQLKQYINNNNYDENYLKIEQLKKQLKKYKTVKGYIFKFNI